MTRFAVIFFILLGFLTTTSPISADASSKAESEVTIQLSGWGDDTHEGKANGLNTGSGDSVLSSAVTKVLPKTGEILSSSFRLLGILFVLGALFFVFLKRRREEAKDEA